MQRAIEGALDYEVATRATGQCDVDMTVARAAMIELIHEIAPGMHVEVSALEKKAEARKMRESQRNLNLYRRALRRESKKSTNKLRQFGRTKESSSAVTQALREGGKKTPMRPQLQVQTARAPTAGADSTPLTHTPSKTPTGLPPASPIDQVADGLQGTPGALKS